MFLVQKLRTIMFYIKMFQYNTGTESNRDIKVSTATKQYRKKEPRKKYITNFTMNGDSFSEAEQNKITIQKTLKCGQNTMVCEFTFSAMNFMKYKCRSTNSNEYLVSKLRCIINVKHTGF